MNETEIIRILVVDDQESIHEDFRKIVSSDFDDQAINEAAAALFEEPVAGDDPGDTFQIDSAHQGEEGVEMVRRALEESRPYPLAFVDVRMPPGCDGVETVHRIWQVDRKILVVLCTAYSDHTWEEIIAHLGRSDNLLILKKPFDVIEVRQMILALTKRWHLARQAELTRDQLEEMVVVRTRALEEAATDLRASNEQLAAAKIAAEAANRAKSEFLANISHEIRTPMTSIIGFAELLRDDITRSQTPDRGVECADAIVRNANHLLQIINDILDLSKIEGGSFGVERAACPPWKIINAAAAMMHAMVHKKGLALRLEKDTPLPKTIYTDPVRLRQILFNLIGNAVKFTDAGEIRLVAGMVTDDPARPLLRVQVIDTGVGMTPDQIARLFQRFSQVDNSPTRKFGGTGLGLAISKRLAELLGGDITVESTPDAGSCFTLTVEAGACNPDAPLCPAPNSAGESPRRMEMTSPAGIRILLAEDAVDNQQLLSLLLARAGYQVTIAENGKAAYELAIEAAEADSPFDLVLMDMQMPIMDGYEATRTLRSEGYTGLIIAITAHASPEDRQECFDAGCDYYLSKPIDREQLMKTATEWITRNDINRIGVSHGSVAATNRG